uniref:Uncharacterized protein n=1 Tax=Guillardia theta TaxID=55529 RepID=A0A7S4P4W7_GUITH|mmetsp:Transcript_43072/g.136077  ORF Transcript_43072/g.136077 Transcript_43072/m.136077 type:complete len:290 (+) Transcript_43072:48-917(+)
MAGEAAMRMAILWAFAIMTGLSTESCGNEKIDIAFVFYYIPDSNTELSRSPYWHDPGFRRALELLEQEHAMIVHRFNIADEQVRPTLEQEISRKRFSFIFAKGCWHTPVDKYMRSRILRLKPKSMKAGLFPACSSAPPPDEETGEPISLVYDVIYYDKLWLRGTFSHHPLAIHAFGVDAGKTFRASGNQRSGGPKLFDYVSVGIFAPWKRHENILDKNGSRLVVGYGWRPQESSEVISALFSGGVAVWQNLHPSKMCLLYMCSLALRCSLQRKELTSRQEHREAADGGQ